MNKTEDYSEIIEELSVLLLDIALKSNPKAQRYPLGQLEKRVGGFLISQLKTMEERVREEIRGLMFMYEHQWPESDKLRICETCGEQVEKGTPCKQSVHYPCWESLNNILDTLITKK